MRIEVWYSGEFYAVAGRKEEVHLPEGSTFEDLVTRINEKYGRPIQTLLSASQTYFASINGQFYNPSADIGKKLHENDLVAFVTIVSGG